MFKSQYQGGSHVEVFSAQGRDPVSRWRLSGPVRREYDRGVRGYVYLMEGGSSTTRIQLPKNEKTQLGLVQPYCVFQLLVPPEARFAIELSLLDAGGSRRRVQLSTSLRELSASPLNARVPLSGIVTGKWVNLCLDLGSLVRGPFHGQQFRSLEGIALGGSCTLRRIFTMRAPPPHTVEGEEEGEGVEPIPKACQMPGGAVAIETQVLTYNSLTNTGQPSQEAPSSVTHSPRSLPSSRGPDSRQTHIAFGSRVAVPEHVLHSRQTSRGNPTESGRGLQPRPPNHPADPSMLRIQRKRVRVLSGRGRGVGKENSGKKMELGVTGSSANVERSDPRTSSPVAPEADLSSQMESEVTSHNPLHDTAATSESSLVSVSESGYRTASSHIPPSEDSQPSVHAVLSSETRLSREGGSGGGLTSDEQLAVSVLQSVGGAMEEDSFSSEGEVGPSDGLLSEQPRGHSLQEELEEGSSVEMEDVDTSLEQPESEREREEFYSYRSPPKSASRRQPNLLLEASANGRGARLDEDFLSPRDNEQGSPPAAEADMSYMTQTRLSNDYDWRQYASDLGDDLTQSDMSLRTRLAAAPLPPPFLLTHPLTDTARSNSSEMGSTSGSMTLSGWAERLKEVARSPGLDSLDTRAMGGALSPTIGTLTDQSDLGVEEGWHGNEDELELMYDPQLNCFYDPHTCKYYELIQ